MAAINRLLCGFAIGCLKAYRWVISPWLGSRCRFHPSCSCYAIEAYQRFGWLKGSVMTCKRLLSCHPFHKGGYDPVYPIEEREY